MVFFNIKYFITRNDKSSVESADLFANNDMMWMDFLMRAVHINDHCEKVRYQESELYGLWSIAVSYFILF